MQLKSLLVVLFLVFNTPYTAEASYISVFLGPKSETYTDAGQSRRSRVNPASLLLEWGVKVKDSWYLAVGATGEVSLDDFSSRGFGINFTVKKYFLGKPSLIEQNGIGSRLTLMEPYGFFVGAGFFHKNLRFSDASLSDLDVNVGGPLAAFGGHYNLSKRYFINSQAQFLISGIGDGDQYISYELYAGIGFRL